MTLVEELVTLATKRACEQRCEPVSTYRLQFHKGFTFFDAAAIVPYLRDLGITHVYASPYLMAVAGSMHGYDVIDPTRINPELGGEAGFARFVGALKRCGMRQILDTVPNHMGVGTNDNPWWNDVLKRGRASPCATYFDIRWTQSPHEGMRGRILLPVLGDHYGAVLSRGELTVVPADDGYAVAYFDRRFPLNQESISQACEASRLDGKELLAAINANTDFLDTVLDQQHYRLAHWKTARDAINYRRFFDINDLIALCTEREEVFGASHALVLRLVADGVVAGLRIDHPDGLRDPRRYFERLQEAHVLIAARAIMETQSRFAEVPEALVRQATELHLQRNHARPLYVVAEKILAADEPLPQCWPIDGTSGYDALNVINGLFIDADNLHAMDSIYRQFVPDVPPYDHLVYEMKLMVLDTSFAIEVQTLCRMLDDIAQSHRDTRDFTRLDIDQGLRRVIACFGVYRSYVTTSGCSESDAKHIEAACGAAAARSPDLDASLFDFIRRVLLQKATAPSDSMLNFVARFQQLTSTATAKGVEDMAFYLYNRLISLNEVGGDPSQFGYRPEPVHNFFADRQRLWPHALNALSTHDTKRSEDVRARINVLSEIPEVWRDSATRWLKLNAPHRGRIGGCNLPVPIPNDEYLLYQTLAGAWPLSEEISDDFIQRIVQYAIKAVREGKQRSSWTRPNEPYEQAFASFIAGVLAPNSAFVPDFADFHRTHIAVAGMLNSLSQTVLRLTLPGVPDTYQGTELWDLSLVDPDNRRPIDYVLRRDLLSQCSLRKQAEMLQQWRDGAVKLFITTRLLKLRREHADLFSHGAYHEVRAEGPLAKHVFAFSRSTAGVRAIVVVPRLTAALLSGTTPSLHLQDSPPTNLHFELAQPMTCALTGRRLDAGQSLSVSVLFANFPVCVLVSG